MIEFVDGAGDLVGSAIVTVGNNKESVVTTDKSCDVLASESGNQLVDFK